MNEIAEILDRAADRVMVAWRQGGVGDPGSDDDPVCAVGALYYATAGLELSKMTAAHQAMESWNVARNGFRSIPMWNDHPGQTAGVVADGMRECAKQLREGDS